MMFWRRFFGLVLVIFCNEYTLGLLCGTAMVSRVGFGVACTRKYDGDMIDCLCW